MYYKSSKFSKLDRLTFKVLDGIHTEKDVQHLSVLLQDDKEARKRYASLTRQEALLHWEASAADGDLSNYNNSSKIFSFPVVSSIAAAIVAMFGVWFIHQYQNNSTTDLQSSFYPKNLLSTDQYLVVSSSSSEHSPLINTAQYDFARKAPVGSAQKAFNDVLYGLEILKNNRHFGDGGEVEYYSDIVSWKRVNHLSVPSENGILPKTGDKMIRFSSLEVNENIQMAEVSETIQILDFREFNSKQPLADNAFLQTSVFFNKETNLYGDETEFSLSFHAVKSNSPNENLTIGHQTSSLESDINPSTWEELRSEFSLPEGTDFVVVSMTAQMEGSNSLLPNLESHYADGLSINLFIDGNVLAGPL